MLSALQSNFIGNVLRYVIIKAEEYRVLNTVPWGTPEVTGS